jgi:hypothetical protein
MAVLVRFREYGLKLKPKKCELFQKEVEFLGRVVGPRRIKRRWRGFWGSPTIIRPFSKNTLRWHFPFRF